MSKRKTRQQKIIADLHRKLESQSVGLPSYTYRNTTQTIATVQPMGSITTNMLSIKHDLIKTSVVTITIIASQLLLFYLLKTHLIRLPMVSY
jgi:hypothetical protein